MSTDAIHSFFDRVMKDQALKDEISKAVRGSDDPAGVTASIAAGHGFQFTSEELTRIVHAADSAPGELSQDELETVAGGLSALDLNTVVLGQSVLKEIQFAPPYIPVGPDN